MTGQGCGVACHDYTLEGDGSAIGFENNERLLKARTNPIATKTFLMGGELCKRFARAIRVL